MHCNFEALVPHEGSDLVTKFIALDKCNPEQPEREFLKVMEIGEPLEGEEMPILKYCADWLAVLKSTNYLLYLGRGRQKLASRKNFQPSSQRLLEIKTLFHNCLEVPINFEQTAPVYEETDEELDFSKVPKPEASISYQTSKFCKVLGIDDPMALMLGKLAKNNNNK